MFGPSGLFQNGFDPFGPQGQQMDTFRSMHRLMDDMFNDPFFAGAGSFRHAPPPPMGPRPSQVSEVFLLIEGCQWSMCDSVSTEDT